MKINIAAPTTGQQKVLEIDDEKRLQNLYERRMAQEIDGDVLGEEFAGYVLRISGGNDKQGFPMRQGVLTNTRVRLLCTKGHKAYRPRRAGERKRKSVRGCIVGQDISVLNLVVAKVGDSPVPGLTDESVPRRLGPKRANKIRKLFNLEKEDDVRKYVIARTFTGKKSGKEVRKAPKIQRLVTPIMLQRKRARKAAKMNSVLRNKEEAAAYKKVVAQRLAEQKEARRSLISKRRSTRKSAKMGTYIRTDRHIRSKCSIKQYNIHSTCRIKQYGHDTHTARTYRDEH